MALLSENYCTFTTTTCCSTHDSLTFQKPIAAPCLKAGGNFKSSSSDVASVYSTPKKIRSSPSTNENSRKLICSTAIKNTVESTSCFEITDDNDSRSPFNSSTLSSEGYGTEEESSTLSSSAKTVSPPPHKYLPEKFHNLSEKNVVIEQNKVKKTARKLSIISDSSSTDEGMTFSKHSKFTDDLIMIDQILDVIESTTSYTRNSLTGVSSDNNNNNLHNSNSNLNIREINSRTPPHDKDHREYLARNNQNLPKQHYQLTRNTITKPTSSDSHFYSQELLKNLMKTQTAYTIPFNYLDRSGSSNIDINNNNNNLGPFKNKTNNNLVENSKITKEMRKILVTWMHQVCEELGLRTEVYLFAVNLLDRFTCRVGGKIAKAQYQLVGAVMLFVASKFKEVDSIAASQLSSYTDYAYSAREITEWEIYILGVIDWDIGYVNHATFIDAILETLESWPDDILQRLHDNSLQFLLLCTLSGDFMTTRQSDLLASCMYLSFFHFELNNPNYQIIYPRLFNHLQLLMEIEQMTFMKLTQSVNDAFQIYLAGTDSTHPLIESQLKFS